MANEWVQACFALREEAAYCLLSDVKDDANWVIHSAACTQGSSLEFFLHACIPHKEIYSMGEV